MNFFFVNFFSRNKMEFLALCLLLPHPIPFRNYTRELIVQKLKKQRIFYECRIQNRRMNFLVNSARV